MITKIELPCECSIVKHNNLLTFTINNVFKMGQFKGDSQMKSCHRS